MSRRPSSVISRVGRALLAASLVLTIALSSSLLPFIALAADPPIGRLEVVIKKIIIHDDRDWGEGEFRFSVRVGHTDQCGDVEFNGPWPDCYGEMARGAPFEINGDDGAIVTLLVPLPRQGDTITEPSAQPGLGFPVQSNRRYGIEISGSEIDSVVDNPMGWTKFTMKQEEFWGEGVHTLRGTVASDELSEIISDTSCDGIVCSSGFGWTPAHYSVELQIRRVPLPDLVAKDIRPRRLDDGRMVYCTVVANEGQQPSGPFLRILRLDGAPVTGGTIETPSLGAGATSELCVLLALTPQDHTLSLRVDDRDIVAEMNDANNEFERSILASAVIGTESIASATSVGPAAPVEPAVATHMDLIVEQIRVNGAGSNSDCDPGKNDVLVNIANQGSASTGGFALRLLVDDEVEDAREKTIAALAAGGRTELTFDDVKIKKKDHVLTATADAVGSVIESREDNNTASITVWCKDEDD
jgi:hypothetical protein